MALRQRLSARQSQRLALTPALRTGLSMLQLPTADLLTEITRQIDENPLLQRDTPSGTAPLDAVARHVAQPETLAQNLSRQIALMPLDPQVSQLAQYLTGDLTEDGFLDSTAEELAQSLVLPLDQVNAAIAALQACDPPGIAARDLAESLALQLIDKGIAADLASATCRHIDLLLDRRWQQAERLTGHPRATLEPLVALIRSLNPRPASAFAEPARPQIPEVIVEKDGQGGFIVALNRAVLPEVHLDAALLAQIERSDPLLRTHLAPAETLIGALRFRAKTLRRVTVALIAHQHRFFSDGGTHMAPLTRAELAAQLGLHPSTVGRTLNGKALLFEGAAYPFEKFLSSALNTSDGQVISALAVQHRIRHMIGNEPVDAPLSDDQIATALLREGVDIARRTVAKYRGCMNIPSSFQRSRLKAARRNRPVAPGSGPPDQS